MDNTAQMLQEHVWNTRIPLNYAKIQPVRLSVKKRACTDKLLHTYPSCSLDIEDFLLRYKMTHKQARGREPGFYGLENWESRFSRVVWMRNTPATGRKVSN